MLGTIVGLKDGVYVGIVLGDLLGGQVGALLGIFDGDKVGYSVGAADVGNEVLGVKDGVKLRI